MLGCKRDIVSGHEVMLEMITTTLIGAQTAPTQHLKELKKLNTP